MMNIRNFELVIWVLSVLIYVSVGFNPVDNYLIDCGSSTNTSDGNRIFIADNSESTLLSTPQHILADTSLNFANSTSFPYDSTLYQTARIFSETSSYTFSIKKPGRHWVRLHFFPFVSGKYNMSTAKFSISALNFTLLKEYRPENGFQVREFSLNISSDQIVLTFIPLANSFAFVSALEVLSLPDNLIPGEVRNVGPQSNDQNLWNMALETISRVNMGNKTVYPRNDTLWRLWISDDTYLMHNNLAKFESNIGKVNFTEGWPTEDFAPSSVYGTATRLNSESDPRINANVTWNFNVDPGFEYLVRFHFCDIVSNTDQRLFFNVYINSWSVRENLNLQNLRSNVLGAPYLLDVMIRVNDGQLLNVSIGPSTLGSAYPNAILNGLEIMKINNSRGSLDILDAVSSKSSNLKVILVSSLASGSFMAVALVVVLVILSRRRKKLAYLDHTKEEVYAMQGGGNIHALQSKDGEGYDIFSISKFGYRFSFGVVQEATDNFSENLVIGVGGFGKVYKGALRDGTEVAVKRGVPQSHQGIAEFQTEIEMLSQFRHRHLVSLIGYCDEHNEMIIIYEYMENGTLKNHLYGSDLPKLSWRQRLEICIGSARGLHYLHTGSVKAIIHRDVKSANILLDENFMAKVADFGLSKTGPETEKTHVSTAVKGSFGYLDPEYLISQQLTEKSDVYSFGVVMFEVLCGRAVIDPSLAQEKVNLMDWTMKRHRVGKLAEIVDPSIVGEIKPESLKKFGEIAAKCLAECGIDRPSMGDVLWNLEFALQLQGTEEGENHHGRSSLQISHSETRVSTAEFSATSIGDLAGISMSKVFAQLVNEDLR